MDRANPNSVLEGKGFIQKNIFIILQFFYYIGVMISRGSILLFKTDRVGLVSFLQLINTLVYLSAAAWKWISWELQVIICIWVGLMGGLSFGNTIFRIRNNPHLEPSTRELATNVGTLSYDYAILLGSITSLVISTLIFPN